MSTQAYPLHWPLRQPRTPAHRRRRHPSFGRSLDESRRDLQLEVERLAGRELVISSNVQLRIDGFPRSGQRSPEDTGVAVYFKRKGAPLVFACDRYDLVEHNLRAIVLHLDALRGMERWGVGSLDQAFAGYAALPEEATGEPWWKTLGLNAPPASEHAVRAAYRDAARRAHPDVGGSQEAFVRVQQALEQGLVAVGSASSVGGRDG